MAEELVLEPSIRDWVLIPLSIVMVLIGILRRQVVIRARNLRTATTISDDIKRFESFKALTGVTVVNESFAS
ncbi:putative integral membrane protein EMC3/TMCO1 [Helianthus anomalus]